MTERIQCAGLGVDSRLHTLVEQDILPGTGVDSETFWQGLGQLLSEFMGRNEELLEMED